MLTNRLTTVNEAHVRLVKRVSIPSVIGALFVAFGVISINISIFLESQILALVGLGLVFWGAIFFLFTPSGFVDSRFLTSNVYSEYSTFNRIMQDLKCRKSWYIPHSMIQQKSKNDNEKSLDPVVLLSVREQWKSSMIEELINKLYEHKFLLANGEGIIITPPGLGLSKIIERKLKNSDNNSKAAKVLDVLSPALKDLNLTKNLTIVSKENYLKLVLENSLFRGLYKKNGDSAFLLGCPLASAVACYIAERLERVVAIDEIQVTNESIEVQYQIVA